jgi:hypothetical protein
VAPKYDKHPSTCVVGVDIGIGIGIDSDPDPDPDGHQAERDVGCDIWVPL